MCERLGCLPNPGGLFQQNRNDVRKMEKVLLAADKRKDDLMKKPASQQRLDQKVEKDESI